MKQFYTRRQFLQLGLTGGFSTIVASYPILIERYLVQVNTYAIPVPNLPDEFEGYTILQLTDLHYGFLVPEWFVAHIISLANKIPKDMIVCTGDYVQKSDSIDHIEKVWSYLNHLSAPGSVFAVLGNHDYSMDTQKSIDCLEKSGFSVRNRMIPIEHNGARIWLGGTGDLWHERINIDELVQNTPESECKVLLSHNPDTADTHIKSRIDLMISGHTHGGQVNIPFLGTPILPVRNKNYTSGFIRADKTNLYISRGIDWAIYPIRFNCPPEISILKLVRDHGPIMDTPASNGLPEFL